LQRDTQNYISGVKTAQKEILCEGNILSFSSSPILHFFLCSHLHASKIYRHRHFPHRQALAYALRPHPVGQRPRNGCVEKNQKGVVHEK